MRYQVAALLLVMAGSVALPGCGGGSSTPTSQAVVALSQSSAFFGANFGLPFNPAPDDVNVSNSGVGALSFTAAPDSPWLTVTPASGSAPSQIAITTALGSLAVGTYTGHVTVSPSGAGTPATVTVTFVVANQPTNMPVWAQWGANPQHTGAVNVLGQNATAQLANIVYEPFVAQEQAENKGAGRGSALTVHYPAPITDGNDVYFMTKTGTYTSCSPTGAWANGAACGPNTWNTEIWNEVRYTWINGAFEPVWTYASDWKPEPNGASLEGWEPVFHAADANGFIYVPGAGGTVWKITQATGSWVTHIDPFSGMNNVTSSDTYVAGPLTADSAGNIYYNVIELANPSAGDPWQTDIQGAWLVKITPGDVPTVLPFSSLVPTAPAGTATTCPGQFNTSSNSLPWPPSNVVGTNQQPPTVLCGSQRPGMNIAPVVAPDGTIYTVSRAHFDSMQSYLVAVKPDFSGAKWVTSMQQLLNDGCGVLVPIGPSNSSPNACRVGATMGVDPTTNAPGSAEVLDLGSSSPVVLPDGSVIFGAITAYNGFRGHMFKFSSAGAFTGSYDFGWDSTPAVYSHGGTFSIVLKDNHYGSALYCSASSSSCQSTTPGPYYITQLDPNMNIQWQFQNTNTQSCSRNANGTLSCTTTNPNGFEWCINMPAVDSAGNVYATSEDGNLYVLPQGNAGVFTAPKANLFLNLALDAAYTPLSIGPDGKVYTQNDGHLFVVGN
jgi:hypothetical protein